MQDSVQDSELTQGSRMETKKPKPNRNPRPSRGASRTVVIASVAIAVPVVTAASYFGWKVTQVAKQGDRAAERGAKYDPAVAVVEDPLMQWRELGEINTGLQSVRGVAIRPDGAYVVAGDQKVRVLTKEGGTTLDIPLASRPQAVAVDADGTFFVGLKDHVEVFSADGKAAGVWATMGADAVITCVTASADHVYVANATVRVVAEYDKTGKLLRELAKEDESKHARGLVVPSAHLDVAPASDGTIWIANPGRHSLEAYDATGTMIRMWGEEGTSVQAFPGCCNPTDFALFPDGSFVTAEKGTPRVKVYTKDGKLDSVVVGPESFAMDKMEGATALALDVAVDHKGRVIVLDPVKRVVRIYQRKN